MQVVPVVPWSMARIIGRDAIYSSSPSPRRAPDVAELLGAVEEPAGGASRRPMRERQLDLLDAESGPNRVDRHADLEAPAVRKRDQLSQRGDPHRALAREGRLHPRVAKPLDRPAGI